MQLDLQGHTVQQLEILEIINAERVLINRKQSIIWAQI